MKKNYVLIVGILLLLLVGGYFGVEKFSGNDDEAVVGIDNVKPKDLSIIKENVSDKKNDSLTFNLIDKNDVLTILNEAIHNKSIDKNELNYNLNKQFNSEEEFLYQLDGLLLTKTTSENITVKKYLNNNLISELKLSEGSIHPINNGFVYNDFSHGQGCLIEFYDFNLNKVNELNPDGCFSNVIIKNTDSITFILIQREIGDNELEIFVFDNDNNSINKYKQSIQNDQIIDLHFNDNKFYLLKRLNGRYLLKIMSEKFEILDSIDLGFVSFNQIEFDKSSIIYLNKNVFTIYDLEKKKNIWEEEFTSPFKLSNISNGNTLLIENKDIGFEFNIISIKKNKIIGQGIYNNSIPFNRFLKLYSFEKYSIVNFNETYIKIQ